MKRTFVEVIDSFNKPQSRHRNWVFDSGKPDPQLAKCVCASVVKATPKFTWRGVFCLLRPAV